MQVGLKVSLIPPQVSLPLTICTLAARLTALTVILAFQVCQLGDMVLVRVEVKVSQLW